VAIARKRERKGGEGREGASGVPPRQIPSYAYGWLKVLQTGSVASGREGTDGGNCPPPLNFGLSDNCLLVGKFSSKNAKFGLNPPSGQKFRGKIEILSTHNHLCRKFAVV